MNELSEVQRMAVGHLDGPMIVLAGPGSGKTFVLTRRVLQLTEQYHINPQNILVITFTRAAAAEMRERYLRLTGGNGTKVTFGTFHAVFFQMLKLAYGYSADNILREKDRFQILREAVYRQHLEPDDETELISSISSEISRVKNEGGLREDYTAASCDTRAFRAVFEEYDQKLRRGRKIDFDDMLIYTYELLSARSDILGAWQRRYRYILVDEFQDINRLQYEIVRLLAKPEDNLFIVGDDDQSIYRFRGSKPEIMLHFEEDYPSAERVLLDTNYRSTVQIVEGAGRVIEFNKDRFPKKLHSAGGPGTDISINRFRDQEEEYAFLIGEIKRLKTQGFSYSDMAVLYRTNTQPRLLVEELISDGLPFNMKDSLPDFYDNWVVKDVFAYLHLAAGEMRRGDFMQVMNRPKRYLSRECLDKPVVDWDGLYNWYSGMPWMYEKIGALKRDLKVLGRLNPAGAVHYISHIIGYEDYLREYAQYRGRSSEELTEVLDELMELAKPFRTVPEWEEHIAKVRKETAAKNRADKSRAEGVSLMTMHGSKGLEFRAVFIIDAVEGVTPHRRSVHPEEIEEERRLFYVAMTRAKEVLYILHMRKMRAKKAEVSRFVEELQGLRDDSKMVR